MAVQTMAPVRWRPWSRMHSGAAQLTLSGTGQASGRPAQAADRVADSLAYDAALARLCDRLALEHELTIDGDVRAARWRAEARLVGRLPTLAAALGVAEQTDVVALP